MKGIIGVLLLSGGIWFVTGCSRPTAETPGVATPTPQRSEQETQKEQKARADAVEAHTMKSEPMTDQPVMTASPSPSASIPKP